MNELVRPVVVEGDLHYHVKRDAKQLQEGKLPDLMAVPVTLWAHCAEKIASSFTQVNAQKLLKQFQYPRRTAIPNPSIVIKQLFSRMTVEEQWALLFHLVIGHDPGDFWPARSAAEILAPESSM